MEDQKLVELYKDVINIDKQKLVSYLKCYLCKGIFRCPMTINECMHTFCKVCIYRHFYSNVNVDSCPSCNTKLGGKPLDTLIFDNSIASLVDIIFPEFDLIDKEACKKMYRAFKDNKQSLPGESEILNTQTPSVKIYLYPFKTTNQSMTLPKLAAPQLVLQKILPMETLKKYLSSKFQNINAEEIQLYFKNFEVPDHFKLQDVEKQYGFSENKNIIHYSKKEQLVVSEIQNNYSTTNQDLFKENN